jgi:hypothetical protein
MTRLAWVVAVVGIVISGRVSAQTRPDFSGVWVGSDKSMVLQQTGSTLTVNEGTQRKAYNLDGSESRFQFGRSEMTAQARWFGSALVVSIATVSPIGEWETVEVYSLDYGPKLSVVEVGSQTTRGVMYTNVKTYAKTTSSARN